MHTQTALTDPKVLVVSGAFDSQVAEMFHSRGFKIVNDTGEAHAIVFTGGADINPELYRERPLHTTHFIVARDKAEIRLFELFKKNKKPMIGICRGGQLLNVLNGGRLIQHIDKHSSDHLIYDLRSKETFLGTSIHHQMMIPGPSGDVLAKAGRASVYHSFDQCYEDNSNPDDRPVTLWNDNEVIAYPKTRTLCYQGHPEIGSTTERDYFFRLVKEFTGLFGTPVQPSFADLEESLGAK